STSDPEHNNPRRWFILAVCLSAQFMALLDGTIVNVALPSIGASLHADATDQQWVVSGYALTFSIVPIIGGRLGDDRGRRLMLLVGTGGFVAASLLSGLAPTPGVLIAGRVIQGLAGGMINPQVSGFVQQLFSPEERPRAFGFLGLNIGVASSLGPVIGGLIISLGGQDWGWRITFLMNVPIGLTAFLLAARDVPRDRKNRTPRPLDLLGVTMLTTGLFLLLFPIVEYDSDRRLDRLVLLVPAFALLTLFLRWERGPARRRGYPLIDTSLFRVSSYRDGLALAFVYFFGLSGSGLVLSLFLQDGLGFSPLESGATATSSAIGVASGAVIAGRHVTRRGRMVLVVALSTVALGTSLGATIVMISTGHTSEAAVALMLCPALFIAGIGGGSVITPNQALSLRDVDVAGGSTAGGMMYTIQRMGAALGAAALTAVYYGRLSTTNASGSARAVDYAHAYGTAVFVSAATAILALTLAIGPTRRERRDRSIAR
ncbi:MAG: MFS transporter, partial [Actinobacteria bacterium]|nr:MFS transporter [Actinomycetota bacterium]